MWSTMPGLTVPSIPVKVFILLHFIFTSWALSEDWLSSSYVFYHLMLLVFGIWAVIQPESHDANQLFLLSILFAIINDCILIGMHFNSDENSHSSKLRFAVSFAFFNLFLKPITAIFILVAYRDNTGVDYVSVKPFTSSGEQGYQSVPEQHGQEKP